MLVYCMYAGNVGCTIYLTLNMLLCDIVFQKYNNQTVEICYIVLTTQSEFTVCIQVQLDILIIVV